MQMVNLWLLRGLFGITGILSTTARTLDASLSGSVSTIEEIAPLN
jgi:hypothetical protein